MAKRKRRADRKASLSHSSRALMLEQLEPRIMLSGTNYFVDSLLDVVASDGVVTLREAIRAANTNLAVNEAAAGSSIDMDNITFDQTALEAEALAADPTWTPADGLTITLSETQLSIIDDLNINGLGSDVLTIDANGNSRVFNISGLTTDVEFSGLTITGGQEEIGGGIYNQYGTLMLTNSTVSGNSANNFGGGIFHESGTLVLTNSIVVKNSAGTGGGIHNQYGMLTLVNSMITSNLAYYDGGGIYGYQGTLMLTNSTVADNGAGFSGGGIKNHGTLTLNNTVVALNIATIDADVDDTFDGSNNFIGTTNGDPIFVRNPSDGGDGWGDDPDTTEIDESTNDDYGDLRLQSVSPLIDAGDNSLALDADGFPLTIDLNGKNRIFNSTVDIGAYEYQGRSLLGDANGDGVVSAGDYASIQTNFGNTGAPGIPGDANGDGVVSAGDYATVQANFGNIGSGILGSKWNDLNADGIRDAEEPGLQGWTIFLDGNGNGILDTGEMATVTDANGDYAFIGLEPGIYTVAEVQQSGWNRTFPISEAPEAGTELIVNGGFETGDFTGWTATDNGLEELEPWTVGLAGSAIGTSPLSGSYDAYNGFDGDAGLTYELYQDVTIPTDCSVTLTTHHRIVQSISVGADDRLFDISIRDTSNAVLTTLYSESVSGQGQQVDLGWNEQVFDLSSFVGQTVRIHFHEYIPERYTGPACLEYDDISLAVSEVYGGVHIVTLSSGQVITGINFGNSLLFPSVIPSVPDLLPATDSGISDSDDITNFDNIDPSRQLQFSVGNTIPGATVTVYADGIIIGNIVATGDTTVVPTNSVLGLTDGDHSFTARQTEPGKTESGDSGSLTVTIDTVAPVIPAVPDLQSTSDTGISKTDNITNDNTPTFSISASPYFRLYRNGTLVSGSYESGTNYTAPTQSDGIYSYSVQAVDVAGNVSDHMSPALIATIDTAAPVTSPGALDNSFNTTGKLAIAFSSMSNGPSDIAVQSDGKIVILGRGSTSNGPALLARINPDGSLDTSFGENGLLVSSVNMGYLGPRAVGIDGDGKIVIGGFISNGENEDFIIARLNADGSLDTSFGGGTGKVLTNVGDGDDYLHDLVIQADGKIITVGRADSGTLICEAVVRYNPDGTLDTTFGDAGKVIVSTGDSSSYTNHVMIDNDGKILTGGYAYEDGSGRFVIHRYNTDGTPDASFGTGGKMLDSFGTSLGGIYNMTLQDDGKIVVVGATAYIDGLRSIAVARYMPNGAFDTSFGSSGGVTTGFGTPFAGADDVAVLDDGKILVAGDVDPGSNSDFVLIRYNPDGSLDTTFDGDGKVRTDFHTSGSYRHDYVTGMVLQSGKALLIGRTPHNATSSGSDIALVQYILGGPTLDLQATSDTGLSDTDNITSDNTPVFDISAGSYFRIFRDGSRISSEYESGGSYTTAVQPDGTYDFTVATVDVAGNQSAPGDTLTVTIDTVGPDVGAGALDETFGTGGTVIAPVGSDAVARDVTIQADGKILVGGNTGSYGSYDLALARFNTDGTLDSSFGTGGKVITSVVSGDDYGSAVAVQPDGKIVQGGFSNVGGSYDFSIVRYNTNGTLDITFGSGGKVVTSLGTGDDYISSVVIQSDGKIVAVGSTRNGGDPDLGMVRYNTDGTLDTTFGTDGIVVTALGTSHNLGGAALIQTDGKILISGEVYSGTAMDSVLVRYNSDGSLDTSFGTDGIAILPLSTDNDSLWSVAIQTDGKIVAGGYSYVDSVRYFAVIRCNSDGSMDETFGTDGLVTTNLGGRPIGHSVLVQSDGMIILAGDIWDYDGWGADFVAVRYHTDGSLDSTFGNGGMVIVEVGASNDWTCSAALQSDGQIILAGSSGVDGHDEFSLARLNASPLINIDLQATSDTGVSDTDKITSDNTPAFDVLAGSYFRMFRDGLLISGEYESGGTYTTAVQPDGTYDFTIAAVDVAGNESVSSNILVTIDTQPPAVAVNPLETTDGTPELSGVVNDPEAEIEVTVNGQSYEAVNNGNGTWTLTDDTITPALPVGIYDVEATATDLAGNSDTDPTTNELTVSDGMESTPVELPLNAEPDVVTTSSVISSESSQLATTEEQIAISKSAKQKTLPTPVGLSENKSNAVARRQFGVLSSNTGSQWHSYSPSLMQLGELDNNNLLSEFGDEVLEGLVILDPLEVM